MEYNIYRDQLVLCAILRIPSSITPSSLFPPPPRVYPTLTYMQIYLLMVSLYKVQTCNQLHSESDWNKDVATMNCQQPEATPVTLHSTVASVLNPPLYINIKVHV